MRHFPGSRRGCLSLLLFESTAVVGGPLIVSSPMAGKQLAGPAHHLGRYGTARRAAQLPMLRVCARVSGPQASDAPSFLSRESSPFNTSPEPNHTMGAHALGRGGHEAQVHYYPDRWSLPHGFEPGIGQGLHAGSYGHAPVRQAHDASYAGRAANLHARIPGRCDVWRTRGHPRL